MAVRHPPGPIPTLGQLHEGGPKWLWLYCLSPSCYHRAPAAIAPFVIRWGPDASSEMLRGAMLGLQRQGRYNDAAELGRLAYRMAAVPGQL